MSKMSKAIAVLGVVAGLGVAALPLSSYAESEIPANSFTKSTNAQVQTTVEGAISISSNIETTGIGGEQKPGVIDLGSLMPGATTDNMATPLEITVNSNSKEATYSLYIHALNEGKMVGQTAGDSIPNVAPTANASGWGYELGTGANGDTFAGTYTALPTEAKKVVTSTQTAQTGGAGDFTNASKFKFQASASTNQTPDTYVGTVVFTAALEN